jgi:hypothetical protein
MIEPDYSEHVQRLLKLGEPEIGAWQDYSTMGISSANIPELIRLVQDESLRWSEAPGDEEEIPEWYAQIHAWRALGQLKAEGAIPALLGILHQVDDYDDDWTGEDLMDAFTQIGPAAITPLAAYLSNPQNKLYARGAAAGSLAQIAEDHPAARDDCLAALAHALEAYEQNDEALNAFIIADLVNQKAVEYIDLMERAFLAERVEEIICGDFEDIQVDLGLLAERKTPPRYSLFRSGLGSRRSEPLDAPRASTQKAAKKEKAKRKQEKLSRKRNRRKKKK